MAYIGKKPEDLIRGNASYNAFTGDGSTTTFDVTNLLPDGGSFDVEVFVDNVRQEAGSSKSYTIGQDGSGDLKRITFSTAPDDGAEIYVINPGRETSLITVADNSISTAKIIADAVTGAKIVDDAINSEHITDGSVDNVHLAGSIANAKLANSSITINGTAVSLGGSVTAGTDWQAVVVADGSTQLTATAGKGYFLDTNTGVIEVFLPASPTRGDTIFLADYGGNFATNNVLVNTGGQLIDSTATGGNAGIDYKLDTNNLVVELVYVDSSKGWQIIENEAKSGLSAADDSNARFTEATGGTITTSGNFKIHTFTGDADFVVSSVGNDAGGGSGVSYVVVAGGGGGVGDRSGGGGAGGYREGKTSSDCYSASPLNAPAGLTVTATTFPVTVGGGGAADNSSPYGPLGGSGSNSVFSTITSAGGGGGGRNSCSTAGAPGGSGGGGGSTSPHTARPGGAGNTPPVSPPQGNNGGASANSSPGYSTGGGGGAGAVGANGSGATAGAGGAGATSSITGSPVARAGGGGGGSDVNNSQASGGSGGGGSGGGGPTGGQTSATDGTANTGGGGGGSSGGGDGVQAGDGGKGIVIIRYKFQ